MPTHRYTVAAEAGGETVTNQVTITEDAAVYADLTAAGEATTAADLAIPYASLSALFITSSQDVTIKTNSADTPDDTITLTAGVPLLWYEGCGHANPLTADVASLHMVVAGATAATVKVRALYDAVA